MFYKTIRIFCTGFVAFASAQILSHLPPYIHVDRNWYVFPSDPIGTVVTRAHSHSASNHSVTYGLKTDDPPVPFAIDPNTGIITVNDTLSDKENSTYILWVTSYNGDLLVRKEILAFITEKSVKRPMLPNSREIPRYPGIPAAILTRNPTTVTTAEIYREVVPYTPAATQDPESTKITPEKVSILTDDNKIENISMTVIYLLAIICGLVLIVAVLLFLIWRRNSSVRTKAIK